jgi:hypothetical protein
MLMLVHGAVGVRFIWAALRFMIGLGDPELLSAAAAVTLWLVYRRVCGQRGRECCRISVVAVQVCDQARQRAGSWRDDSGPRHCRCPLADPLEDRGGVFERINDDALALFLDLDTSPTEPPDPHVQAPSKSLANGRAAYTNTVV